MASTTTHISNCEHEPPTKPLAFTSSVSFKACKKTNFFRRNLLCRLNDDDIVTLMHGSDPVRVELNRLENDIRDKDRELGDAVAEIKSLRNSEHLKERAVKEDNKVVDEVVKEEMFGL
ncbi:hypothetical protein ACFX2I_011905 [Malus domestica]